MHLPYGFRARPPLSLFLLFLVAILFLIIKTMWPHPRHITTPKSVCSFLKHFHFKSSLWFFEHVWHLNFIMYLMKHITLSKSNNDNDNHNAVHDWLKWSIHYLILNKINSLNKIQMDNGTRITKTILILLHAPKI